MDMAGMSWEEYERELRYADELRYCQALTPRELKDVEHRNGAVDAWLDDDENFEGPDMEVDDLLETLGLTSFVGADLRRFRLASDYVALSMRDVDFTGANLEMSFWDPSTVTFIGAILRDTRLVESSLRGVCLAGADLRGADLRGADLRGADLSRADLRGANLSDTELDGADLSGAQLDGATIRGSRIEGLQALGALTLTLPMAKGFATLPDWEHELLTTTIMLVPTRDMTRERITERDWMLITSGTHTRAQREQIHALMAAHKEIIMAMTAHL